MKLKRSLNRFCSVLLALLLLCLPLTTAGAVYYPEGVTAEAATQSVPRMDTLLKNAVPALTGKSFSAFVYGILYSDDTLSSILTGIYGTAEEQSTVLSGLGIDISPANVAKGLSAYPAVQQRVAAASGWSTLNLSGASWGVGSKSGFAAAISAMAIPFNDILYTLLCEGEYQAGLLTLHGGAGYRDGLIPMLQALGCTSIPSDTAFRAQANQNRTMMLYQVALSLLSLVDAIVAGPMTKLTSLLPGLAIYVRDGGLEHSVDVILSPLSPSIGPLPNPFTGSRMLQVMMFLKNPASITKSFAENVTASLNNMTSKSGVTLASVNLDALASCKGNSGACLAEVLRWVFETMKLNRGKINDMLASTGTPDPAALTDPLLMRSPGELTFIVIHLLTTSETMPLLYQWSRYPFTPVSVEYTKKLGKKEFKRVLTGIDEVIGEFTSEFAGGDLQTTLGRSIYSSATVTSIAKMLYGAFSDGEMKIVAAALGLPASPAALASVLPSGYRTAKNTLYRYSSWENLYAVPWGVTSGSRASFQRALTAVLRPMRPLLQGLLANDTLPVFGAMRLPGSNGYNTAVIPLLEALSCPDDQIKTYVDYCKGKGTDAILTDLLNPVLSLVDRLIKQPIYTITAILPNLAYRLANGELTQCVSNLLYPLTETLHQFGYNLEKLGVDFSDLSELNMTDLLSGFFKDVPAQMDFSSLDIAQFAGMGTLVTHESKRVTGGKAVKIDYVKADKTAVLITLLRWAVDLVRDPENADLLTGMMNEDDMPATFQQFSAGITDKLADMTTDETIEWLYQLFFRERAKKQIKDDDYEPHIIYEPESHALRNTLLILGGVLLLGGGAVLVWRRKDVRRWIEKRKKKKEV